MAQTTRFWVMAVLSGLAGVLGVLTAAWPDWIERTTGLDPDGGNGALEWLIVVVLLTTAVVLGRNARRAWRVIPQH